MTPLAEGVTYTIATLVSDVGSLVTGAVSWIGSYMGAITSNALLEAFVITAFVGLGVGLIKRIIRL